MKANEFVKEHGFQYTRNLVRDYPNHTHVTDDGRMFINGNTCESHIKVQLNELVKMDDLKRLVESYELVEKYKNTYGESARWFFIAEYCKEHRLAPHQADVYAFVAAKYDSYVAAVESCQ